MTALRVAMLAPPWLPIPPDGYGGVENVLHALVPELLKLRVEVELFTVGDTTVPSTKQHSLYETGQYEHIHMPHYNALPILTAHVLFALNSIRKDGHFDIIHDHNMAVGPLAGAFSDSCLPPMIHTIHNPPFTTQDWLDRGETDNLPMWKQLACAEKLYIVPISHSLGRGAPKELKRRMLTPVHNAVNLDDFPFKTEKDDYYITLGRFNQEKGIALAVQACLALGQRLKMASAVAGISRPNKVMLELANPLSRFRSNHEFRYYSDQIFPYLDEQIEYVGEIAGQRKMDFISNAKALLFPIQWEEPFGVVPIEALSCGTPVVAMARGALPEIIQHGVNGFLAHNMREFKRYMMRVGDIDPQDCRDSVAKNFSAPVMAKRYLARYKQVIRKHPR